MMEDATIGPERKFSRRFLWAINLSKSLILNRKRKWLKESRNVTRIVNTRFKKKEDRKGRGTRFWQESLELFREGNSTLMSKVLVHQTGRVGKDSRSWREDRVRRLRQRRKPRLDEPGRTVRETARDQRQGAAPDTSCEP